MKSRIEAVERNECIMYRDNENGVLEDQLTQNRKLNEMKALALWPTVQSCVCLHPEKNGVGVISSDAASCRRLLLLMLA